MAGNDDLLFEVAQPSMMGRPKSLEVTQKTLKQVHSLATIQCTKKEAAAVMGVAENTFNGFLKDNPLADAAWRDGLEAGPASLRRMQWKSAQAGNVTMLVFLGKQMLGQTDKNLHRHEGQGGGPIQHVDLAAATDDQLQVLNEFLKVAAVAKPDDATGGEPAPAGPGGDNPPPG